jgi:recombinational DNA repair ATPase RecF
VDDELLGVVLARLDKVPLAEDAVSLLLAALEGDTSLAERLSASGSPASVARPGDHVPAPSAGAFLQSVTVCGFRGVGPCSTLELEPGPGLTLVVGRNGSGKSSFAEGLEVLLTGDLRRWQELKVAVWKDGWRNLHVPDPARISAELLVEGAGQATVERTWSSDAALDNSHATMQIAGHKRGGLDQLGWARDLVTYRPFLSHSELEAFFNGPSRLYDLLSSVLGLDDLTAAEQRLSAARKERKTRMDEVSKDLPALLARLESEADERAASCREALAAKKNDVERALAIATGGTSAQPGDEIGRLRQLSQLTAPSEEHVSEVVGVLRSAAHAIDVTAGSQAGQARELAGLLRSALDHYRVHGASDCPVCGQAGVLDDAWRVRTEQEITRLEAEATTAQAAHDQAKDARMAAGDLFMPIPAALSGSPVAEVDPEPAAVAWKAWTKHPEDDLRALAEHIERTWSPLRDAVTALASAAAVALRAREDHWAPLAADVTAWCTRAQEAKAEARPVPVLQAAITWLKSATDDIRNARLEPLGERARAIWAQLRQESNVDLGAIRLSGSATRRQVDVNVTVDGSPTAALGVMSQGEVNALALSIFLPRATVKASPFRFLVIDDPVQAMDPAKVEGLAQVLNEFAASRQVVVFTHDDRLPEAVRRLGIQARILEVSRRPGSVVEIRHSRTPVEGLLKDAGAVCADPDLPEDVAARVVPGLCRLAVEAAFTEAIRRRELRAGKRHADIEAEIDAADTLTKRAALAMFGDADQGGDVLRQLNHWQRNRVAGDTFRELNKGTHVAYDGSLRGLIHDTRQLTDLISGKLS